MLVTWETGGGQAREYTVGRTKQAAMFRGCAFSLPHKPLTSARETFSKLCRRQSEFFQKP